MDYWLALLAAVLTMTADRAGRARLAWLVAGSALAPLCAAQALLATAEQA